MRSGECSEAPNPGSWWCLRWWSSSSWLDGTAESPWCQRQSASVLRATAVASIVVMDAKAGAARAEPGAHGAFALASVLGSASLGVGLQRSDGGLLAIGPKDADFRRVLRPKHPGSVPESELGVVLPGAPGLAVGQQVVRLTLVLRAPDDLSGVPGDALADGCGMVRRRHGRGCRGHALGHVALPGPPGFRLGIPIAPSFFGQVAGPVGEPGQVVAAALLGDRHRRHG